ncbi:MAG: hypothetical protein WAM14_17090, partial [Candidatus Nitrosopolaris sp.]
IIVKCDENKILICADPDVLASEMGANNTPNVKKSVKGKTDEETKMKKGITLVVFAIIIFWVSSFISGVQNSNVAMQ